MKFASIKAGIRRQRVRTALMLAWILLFPATLFYFSPYLPYEGLAEGVIPGSLLLFGLLFIFSSILGRLFCGWLCPGGAIQHFTALSNPRPLPSIRLRLVKYILIWFPWVGGLVAVVLTRQGSYTVDILYQTQNGLSVTQPKAYIIYLAVVMVFAGLSFAVGRRAACHTVCWMAPFMVFGSAVGKALKLPRAHLRTIPEACVHCGACDRACPMSLPVERLTGRGSIDVHDCILCGSCADVCPSRIISFRFSRESKPTQRATAGSLSRGKKRGTKTSVILLFLMCMSGCALDDDPLLVPPTVAEDPTLPRLHISVSGKTRSVHYRTFGDSSNQALFVMPGSLSDLTPYRVFEEFAESYFVVLWDQRGQGLSERVSREELSFEAMTEEIAQVKSLLSPNASISLLGHSWSAVFAALYAAKYPADVKRLILLEPFGFQSDSMKKANAGQLNLMTPGYLDMVWLSGIIPIRNHEELDFRMRGVNSSGVRPFFKDPRNLPAWPVKRVGGLALLTWEAALYVNGVWDYDLSSNFNAIQGDVLLVGSEYSFIGYSFQREFNAPLFTAARVHLFQLADSGHRMITENWLELKAGIQAFLNATL